MKLLKAITTDGELQYFNLNLILNMTPSRDGERVKILMGAGLFWWVQRDTIEIMDSPPVEIAKMIGGHFV